MVPFDVGQVVRLLGSDGLAGIRGPVGVQPGFQFFKLSSKGRHRVILLRRRECHGRQFSHHGAPPRLDIPALQPHGRLVRLAGLRRVANPHECIAKPVLRIWLPAIRSKRLAQQRSGGLPVSPIDMNESEVVGRLRNVGIELECGLQVRLCLLRLAAVFQQGTEVGMRTGMTGVSVHRGLETSQRIIELAALKEQVARLEISFGGTRIDGNMGRLEKVEHTAALLGTNQE